MKKTDEYKLLIRDCAPDAVRLVIDSCRIIFLALAVVVAVQASAAGVTAGVEDIRPYYPSGWEADDTPEDMTPIHRKRNLLEVEPEPEPVIKEVQKTGEGSVLTMVSSGAEDGTATGTISLVEPEVDEEEVAKALAAAEAEAARKEAMKEVLIKKKLDAGPFSGFVRLKYQTASASGDELGFLSRNGMLFFNDKLQQSTRIDIDKKFENGMMVEGRFVDEPYRDQHLHFKVDGRRGHAYLGDINTSFRGGELVAFAKQARGLDIDYDFGPVSMFAMLSREKSSTERETFRGRNVRGPYALRSASLLENSESVYINGQPVSKADYDIDYFLGQITFNYNIDSSDLVEITYESILQVSLKTGSLRGIGFYTDKKNPKYDIGVSYLEEGTSRIDESAVYEYEMPDEYNVENGEKINLDHNYIKIDSEILTLSINGEKRYLDRDNDYTITYYDGGYYEDSNLFGSITLADDLLTATEDILDNTLIIRYSYYNTKYLQSVSETLDVFDYDDTEYVLSYERIYPGPEVVYYVDDFRRIQLYGYGLDSEVNAYYEIDHVNNIILFHWDESIPDYSENPRIEISYEIVPANSPGETDATRTVWDVNGRMTVGDANFRGEYAETNSDITTKAIFVVEERVATVSNSTLLKYPLNYPAIRNTESIYFNDTVSSKSRQRSGSDYVMEYEQDGSAYLQFKDEIPVGTTIIASYKYNPSVPSDSVRTGKAGRVLADWDVFGGTIGLEYMLKSDYFSPMTSFNDQERERLGFNFQYAPGKKWDSEFSYRSRQDIADYQTGEYFLTKEMGANVKYKYRPKSYVAYTYERLTYRNGKKVRTTDIGRDRHRLEGMYSYRDGNHFVAKYHMETRDMNDETGLTSDQDATKYGVDVTYRPDEKLSVNLSTNRNELVFDAPQEVDGIEIPDEIGDFVTLTTSNVMDVTYLPTPVWTLNTRLDMQEIEDEREETGNDSVHKIHAAVFSRPIQKFRRIYLAFDRRDRPNPYYGDSRTESSNFKFTYEIAKNWSMTPGYTVTRSTIQDRSKSDNSNMGMQLDYREKEKKGWTGSVNYSTSTRESSRLTSEETGWTDSSSDQDKMTFTTRYSSGSRYEWKNSATYVQGGSDSAGKRSSITSILDYMYSNHTKLNLLYNVEETTQSNGDRVKFQLGSVTNLSENFKLGLTLKREKEKGTETSTGYTGTLFNMTLDMIF